MKNKIFESVKGWLIVMADVILLLFGIALGINLVFALFKLSVWLWGL